MSHCSKQAYRIFIIQRPHCIKTSCLNFIRVAFQSVFWMKFSIKSITYAYSMQVGQLNVRAMTDMAGCEAMCLDNTRKFVSKRVSPVSQDTYEYWSKSCTKTIFTQVLERVAYNARACCRDLTLKAPITTAADDIHKHFFIVFQRK